MVRARVYRKVRRSWAASHEPVCLSCLPDGGVALARSSDGRTDAYAPGRGREAPVPCDVCGLPVQLAPDKRRKVATCSDTCRSRHYSARDDSVTDAQTLVCEGCGETMTGRADRRFCSSACRQRAYRRRRQSVVLDLVRYGIAQEDAGHVDVFSRLDAEQFEAVLARARQDDDLSAGHVADLAREVLSQP